MRGKDPQHFEHLSSSVFSAPYAKPWVIAVGVLVSCIVLEYAGLLQWFRSGVEFGTQPLRQTTVKMLHVFQQPLEFARVSNMKYTYILDLELKYSQAAAELSEMQKLRQENQELRTLLEQEKASPSAQTKNFSRRFVSIVSYAQPTIALGSADGLRGGEAVRIAGTLIGKVTILADHQAQLRLLHIASPTDPILGQIEGGVSGIVTGNGTEVVMKEVPVEASIEVGKRVETRGQFGMQSGLYIGRVQRIIREEGAPTQTIIIDQGVSFFRTTVVEVLL